MKPWKHAAALFVLTGACSIELERPAPPSAPAPPTPVDEPRQLPAARMPTGVLDDAAVQRTKTRHKNELRFCLEQEATPQPSAASRVRVELTVTHNGSATEVGLVERSDDVPKRLAQCLINAVERWTFPRPSGGSALVTLELLH